MTKLNVNQLNDEDRPVVSISKIGNAPIDVFMCPADAEVIAEDLLADEIIDACNGIKRPSMYKWEWYNEQIHGTYEQIAKNLYMDLDDAARDMFCEEDDF